MMRRITIYRVIRRKRTYYVRAIDSAAVDNLAAQYGCPATTIERAPGMSKKAIDMWEYACKERAIDRAIKAVKRRFKRAIQMAIQKAMQ